MKGIVYPCYCMLNSSLMTLLAGKGLEDTDLLKKILFDLPAWSEQGKKGFFSSSFNYHYCVHRSSESPIWA